MFDAGWFCHLADIYIIGMAIVEVFLWVLIIAVFYCYVGYGLIVLLYRLFKREAEILNGSFNLPDVTLIIPSYNEEAVLHHKIENVLSLNYPREKLKVIVAAHGSNDSSIQILSQYKQVQIVFLPERKGKAAALNHSMEQVSSPVVVFSDANSLLNKESIMNLIKHFQDKKIGGVSGEKKIIRSSGIGTAEGFYWQYESLMKQLDASFYTVVGAAGELFAMRTNLYKKLDEDVLLDDFVLSINVCFQGYRIAYEPNAYAAEAASLSLADEKIRKIRIAAGAFQSLKKMNIQRVLTNAKLAFQFFSRRWLRWVVCPVAIILLLVLNVILVAAIQGFIYKILLIAQVLFYIAALIGWLLIKKDKTFVPATIPFYFLFMNYCMLLGMIKFYTNKHSVLW
ncbi:MAG: glycosyltransferase family 2 protein, partial [Chitinophagaceae bacterium]|nr:glycosyltransferase family 2 protein [Chitinophagaceae bacterium]